MEYFEIVAETIVDFSRQNPALAIVMGVISMYFMPKLFTMSVRLATASNETTHRAVGTIDDSVGVISQLTKSLTEGLKDLTTGVESAVALLREDIAARKELAEKEGELLVALTERVESMDRNMQKIDSGFKQVEGMVVDAVNKVEAAVTTAMENAFVRCAGEIKEIIHLAIKSEVPQQTPSEENTIDKET